MVVRLPIHEDDGQAAVPKRADHEDAAPIAIRPCRVLIVDDNRDAADSMAFALQYAGHAVATAYSGAEGIERASVFEPDVVLLDLGMPGLNGFEIARRIRQQPWGATLALIALTGWGQEQDRRRTKEAGFDAHLTKPVSATELLKTLEDAMAAGGDRPRPSRT